MSEQTVDAHNRVALWRDIANHLTVALEATVHAQVGLEDLATYGVEEGPAFADQLNPIVDQLRRAANDASAET